MALKPCKECRKEISSEAKVCPKCGKKDPTAVPTRRLKIGLIVLMALVAFVTLEAIISNTYFKPSSTRGPDSKLETDLLVAAHQRPPDRPRRVVPYDIVRQWLPNHERTGYGADLVISPDATESDVTDLVAFLAGSHDPVSIGVYLSQDAYDDGQRSNPSAVFGNGYVGAYVKNLSSGGAFRGFNEFRWAQEQGRFSHLTGQVTKF